MKTENDKLKAEIKAMRRVLDEVYRNMAFLKKSLISHKHLDNKVLDSIESKIEDYPPYSKQRKHELDYEFEK